jgi:ADP-ribose pyrophosphatase YjhB (NUDIX family)
MPQFVRRVPQGDDRERLICPDCGHVDYQNPKVVVGSVVVFDGRVLLCRRAIEPRRGFWTLPAGYLELGETVAEGAVREAAEEACARIAIDGILAVFSISRIGQVQVMFRARFADAGAPYFAPGVESLEVRLFAWDEIPWQEIAFPSVHWALAEWRRVGAAPLGAPAGNPDDDSRGTSPLEGGGPCVHSPSAATAARDRDAAIAAPHGAAAVAAGGTA